MRRRFVWLLGLLLVLGYVSAHFVTKAAGPAIDASGCQGDPASWLCPGRGLSLNGKQQRFASYFRRHHACSPDGYGACAFRRRPVPRAASPEQTNGGPLHPPSAKSADERSPRRGRPSG